MKVKVTPLRCKGVQRQRWMRAMGKVRGDLVIGDRRDTINNRMTPDCGAALYRRSGAAPLDPVRRAAAVVERYAAAADRQRASGRMERCHHRLCANLAGEPIGRRRHAPTRSRRGCAGRAGRTRAAAGEHKPVVISAGCPHLRPTRRPAANPGAPSQLPGKACEWIGVADKRMPLEIGDAATQHPVIGLRIHLERLAVAR